LAQALQAADVIVVGAGFAGAVVARELAERGGRRVTLLEQRHHIGGNAYDEYDASGVLVHRYGPHIFHTNSRRVFDYLSRYTGWYTYHHQVLADIHGIYTPVPFNFNSIELHFAADEAQRIIARLLEVFGPDTKIPIIELRKSADPLLERLADFVYRNVFLYYTQKQWGLRPEEIDPAVTARVPVFSGRDNRYFTDHYQGMPAAGYTPLFENLLAHPNISVFTGIDARSILGFLTADDGANTGADNKNATALPAVRVPHTLKATRSGGAAAGVSQVGDGDTDMLTSRNSGGPTGRAQGTLADTAPASDQPFTRILASNRPFTGTLIYTGPLDVLAAQRFGLLPYRSLDFVYKTVEQKRVLPCGTVNYTVSEDYTRITEFTWLTGQNLNHTTLMEEYPLAFTDQPGQIPYYAISSSKNEAAYRRYLALFNSLPGFFALGRLAEYRYYNMDQIVERALTLADRLCAKEKGK
jgi:UDP-galactopyranose mutase